MYLKNNLEDYSCLSDQDLESIIYKEIPFLRGENRTQHTVHEGHPSENGKKK